MTIAIAPTALASAGPALERARGTLSLAVACRGGRHGIADLGQSGCGRLLFPKVAVGEPLEAVMVNTSGGLTGGDRFETRIVVAPGARAVLTTQACEKIYRADGIDPASVAAVIEVGETAMLAWLPQETILFDRARLTRRL